VYPQLDSEDTYSHTWKTLSNHVFEDLRKPKAPNSPPMRPDGPRPETVLSGLILRTVRSTNPKNHTVPAQTIFGTCGLSAQQSRMVHTIIQGLYRKQPSLVRTADAPALRPGRSAVQRNKIGSKWSDFGPLWWIADGPPSRPERSAHPRLCTFQTSF
jgi:hypothetical protein